MLDKLHRRLPPDLSELLTIPGLGPKRVKILYHDLDIHTLEQLHRAARDGRLRELPGFGEKTEQNILHALESRVGVSDRFKLALAAQYAEPLTDFLRKVEGVKEVVIAGSYRRARETVGDIDILVTAAPGSPVMARFTGYDEVKEVVSQGPTRATVILRCGLQVDLRLVRQESYGAALHYFTGSKAHNIAIRTLARQRGLKINEYGVFRGRKRVAGETEESVFRAVDLPWIPPKDLRGDLHAHTRATDGHNTLQEMAEAARACGLEYLAITEHSRRLTVAKGFTPERLLKQMEEIERLNERLEGITLLKGIEVDILEDGRLESRWTSWRTDGWTCPTTCWAGWIWWWPRCTASSTSAAAGRPPQADRAHPAGHGPPPFHHPRPPHRAVDPAARALRRGHAAHHPPAASSSSTPIPSGSTCWPATVGWRATRGSW